ncbi:hypothetical protein HON36_01395 [Candidatus Parcubacteria bacterium]|jgi:hypothetical protein|nr:hypothetical protein [Candidatus Parcubacteria bacterium]
MTGEQLFLRYAFPCVQAREIMGKISPKHSQELTTWAIQDLQPTRRRLKFCFPHAFRALRQLARANNRQTWSLINVQDYWRSNHGHEGDCAVQLVTVVNLNKIVTVNNGADQLPVVNLYGLHLRVGDKVYTHKRCIVELAA